MKNLTKVIALGWLFLLLAQSSYAQTKEIGARFSGLERFSLIYKKEKKENKYMRARFIIASASLIGVSDNMDLGIQAGFAVGSEKRKAINEKLNFIHGVEPSLLINYSGGSNTSKAINVSPGIGYVLGFQYSFNEDFYVSLETIPGINGTFSFVENSNNLYGLNLGFNSSVASVTLAYRFNSQK